MSKWHVLCDNAVEAQSALNLKMLISPAGAVLVKYIFFLSMQSVFIFGSLLCLFQMFVLRSLPDLLGLVKKNAFPKQSLRGNGFY